MMNKGVLEYCVSSEVFGSMILTLLVTLLLLLNLEGGQKKNKMK